MAALPHPGALVKELGEKVLGVLLLALAAIAWIGRLRLARSLEEPSGRSARGAGAAAAFVLGVGIMAVEFPTAFPYFGAVAAIIGSRISLVGQMLLIVLFNLAFVLPLLAILALRAAAGERAAARLAGLRRGIARLAGATLAVLFGTGGLALIAVGFGLL